MQVEKSPALAGDFFYPAYKQPNFSKYECQKFIG
jgi:hypothetical protein